MVPGTLNTQNTMLISKIVASEIELFMERQTLTQKNLKNFEKEVWKILEADPRIAPLLKSEQDDAS